MQEPLPLATASEVSRPRRDRSGDAQVLLARAVSRSLGEHAGPAKITIKRLGRVLGETGVWRLVEAALKVEETGGMLVPDGSRRRTTGGVFFALARAALTPDQHLLVFKRPPPDPTAPPRPAPPRPQPPAQWIEVVRLANSLRRPGEVSTVTLKLVGRPNIIRRTGDVFIMNMASGRVPSLPTQLAHLPAPPTTYTLFVAAKTWMKVSDAVADPDDRFIVEGFPVVDPRIPGITVHVQRMTTVNTERVKRDAQRAAAPAATDERPKSGIRRIAAPQRAAD